MEPVTTPTRLDTISLSDPSHFDLVAWFLKVPQGMDYGTFVGILLTVIAIVLTALAIIIGMVGLRSYGEMQQAARDMRHEAERYSNAIQSIEGTWLEHGRLIFIDKVDPSHSNPLILVGTFNKARQGKYNILFSIEKSQNFYIFKILEKDEKFFKAQAINTGTFYEPSEDGLNTIVVSWIAIGPTRDELSQS